MNFKPNFNETAVITEYNLIKKIGRLRFYSVKFIRKRAYLVTDHPIKKQYSHLHRITNYKFLGLERYESN